MNPKYLLWLIPLSLLVGGLLGYAMGFFSGVSLVMPEKVNISIDLSDGYEEWTAGIDTMMEGMTNLSDQCYKDCHACGLWYQQQQGGNDK